MKHTKFIDSSMALILHIETSTEVCSVSLSEDGELLAYREDDKDKSHASKLTPFVDSVLKEKSVNIRDLAAVCVSEGPGSYTGLRIGVSVAKGLCYGLNIPLIAVSSIKAMALTCINKTDNPDRFLFCPLMDARRMEVYTALYDGKLNALEDIHARVIDDDSFEEYLSQKKIIFFGNGADKCKQTISSSNAIFNDEIRCSAVSMVGLSHESYKAKKFKDVAYFEPYYLKNFVATKPKRNIF